MDRQSVACLSAAAAIAVLLAQSRPPAVPRRLLVVLGAAVLAVATSRLVPVHLVVAGSLVALAVAREVRRRNSRRANAARRDVAIATCTGLAADLRAGTPPVHALRAAVLDWSELAPVAAAADLDADVPEALRRVAELPGAATVRWIASAWVVGNRSGAGLAGAVERAASFMIDERDHARVLETELASARATARLLGVLPLVVLLIGSGAGGDPFAFLLDSAPGTGCLFSGLALAWAGNVWIEHIADRIVPVVTYAVVAALAAAATALALPGVGRAPKAALGAEAQPDVALLRRLRLPLTVGAGLGGWLLIGGFAGLAAGALAAVAGWRTLARVESPAALRRRDELERDLPMAVHLLGAALASGASVDRALEDVADAMLGPVAEEFGLLRRRLAVDVDPAAVWRSLEGPLAPIGRALGRAHESGARVTGTVDRLADELLATTRARRAAAVRGVEVQSAAPLGLCFLPAFVLLGVVPMVAAIFGSLHLLG